MSPETAAAVARGDAPKGDVIGTARLAGIQAAKRTFELIPLAHPLALNFVDVIGCTSTSTRGFVTLTGEARTVGRTGVELEAMTACAIAALTVYDMVKGIEKGVEIECVGLVSKAGGRSGEWVQGDARPMSDEPFRAAVIAISTSKSAGEGEDESGPKPRGAPRGRGLRGRRASS